uniref:MauE/DoxX family redox-associated membrane protein n=1 Tax=Fulvivirga sp. TaxID=1931237 RepID=UPI00404B8F11
MKEITLNPPALQVEAETAPLLEELNSYVSLAGDYSLQPAANNTSQAIAPTNTEEKKGLWVYYPIFLIAGYIAGVALINNLHWQGIHWQGWMNQFMAGFFLVFSAFKLLDIKGFADGYSTYDLLAQRWHTYGFIYPFLELGLGVLYLSGALPIATQFATIIIMGFSSLGVINSLLKKRTIQCACLGTLLKVPLSSITLIEDLTMVGLAALSLIMR